MRNRRPWPLATLGIAAALAATLTLTACDDAASAAEASTAAGATTSSAGASAAWDETVVHDIAIDYDADEYQALIDAYLADGSKEWISATVTIDGVTYENVGLKLKGNSSLRSITADTSAEDLPWLIRLDKFVDGQNHLGATEYVIRSNSSETALNEAVALDLLELAGLASEAAIAVEFSAGGSDAVLRLAVENPTDAWMEAELGDGYLYKAEAQGSYDYLGVDASAYSDAFDQEGGEDNLEPLVAFLQFINESDDATFAAELGDWLDVDSFATYLAFQELVDNFDDIDGPGNNSYLYYDTDTGLMTVVNWDLNLAFGASPDGGGMGQGGGMPADGVGQGGMPAMGERPTGALPTDGTLPAAGELPSGGELPTGGPGGGEMGGMGGSNVLSTRFLADADFAALYESELSRLTELLYGSGAAQEVLQSRAEVLINNATTDADRELIKDEAAALEAAFPTTD